MEQNNINKEVEVASVKDADLKEVVEDTKEKNGGKYVFLAIVIAVSISAIYSYWWVPRQECLESVSYHPAGTDIVKSGGLRYAVEVTTNTESYYNYIYGKFKTKNEAISACMRKKKF